MSTNNIRLNIVNPGDYKPQKLRIDSIGIGLSDETNDSLNLTDTQHLIVGERLINASGQTTKTYGLVVDKEGISVNSTLQDRARLKGQYAAYIDGSVFVSGAVVACNLVGGGSSNRADAYWKMASFETDNIFYENKITLGNDSSARSNAHALSIVQSADRTIEHAQISVQNTQQSQLRMGIVGTSNISPAVINTTRGVPIEFHVARDQSHFEQTYLRSYWENGSNITVPSEVPRYVASNAPQLIIGADGKVGINTSFNPIISYELRVPYPGSSNVMSFPRVNEQMSLHVDGPLYASNLLIMDYETGKPDNIDRLYVRRKGVTFEANQVIPGPFANGIYTFLSNVAISGEAENDFDLKVHGAQRITEYLQVDGMAKVNKVEINDAVLLEVASFCNDVYMQQDLILKESLRLRGGLFTEVRDGSNVYWCNVQFTIANSGFSNINYFGLGFTTPGRVGVGIDPRYDEVNNQLVIRKRAEDIYELEIYDKSTSKINKAAYIGHPPTSFSRQNDGSLVFATPSAIDPNYNRGFYPQSPQNFYFYPGSYTNRTEPLVSDTVMPTLNVHSSKRIGVLTYDPMYTLDVRGDIAFSGSLVQGTTRVGIWKDKTYANIYSSGGSNPTFRGIEYFEPGACNVGVNMQPDPRYGMTVAGKLKSVQGYFTADDREIIPWFDSATSSNAVAPLQTDRMFTFRQVGVGIRDPSAMLDIKNNYGRSTVLRLNSPERNIEYTATTQVQFAGLNDPWIIQGNDTLQRLEFAYGQCNLANPSARRAMWMRNSTLYNKQQVIVGGSETFFNSNIPDPAASLLVDGGLSVNGNVSITGRYIINGTPLVNSNIVGDSNLTLSLTNDDVFIGGNRIFMNPNVTGGNFVAVNFDTNRLSSGPERASRAPFRVYNSDSDNTIISRFITNSATGLLELASTTTANTVRMGFRNDGSFAVQDRNDTAFFNVKAPTTGQRFVTFAANREPTASLHVQNEDVGSNMLRLTRYASGADTTALAPQLELEKVIENNITGRVQNRWIFHGPDASFNQKLALRYGIGASGEASELFCFTDSGCLGIGKTNPEFALDIQATGKRGTLRLLNTTNDPLPQILLQSGSNDYGADSLTDYRIYSFSNELVIDSVNTTEHKELLHFMENGSLGIGTVPSSNYTVNIGGILNVKQAILLDGNPLFDTEGSDAQEGFNIRAVNIFLRPRTEFDGGVVINRAFGTCNLFHVFSGQNNNMMVLDSTDNESQIHFRCTQDEGVGAYNMYRLAQSNMTFRLAHQPFSASNGAYVPDSYEGYCNVVGWGPSTRVGATGEYDMNLYGSLTLHGASPILMLKDSNTTLSAVDNSIHIAATSGVGIGSETPSAYTHVYQAVPSTQVPCFIAEQSTSVGAGDIARFMSDAISRMVIQTDGNVGIGTTNPNGALHVINNMRISDTTGGLGGVMYLGNDNVGIKRGALATFANVNDLVLFNTSNVGVIGFATNSLERMRITASGNVGVGTTNPLVPLHVWANNATATLRTTQMGAGDIFRATGSNIDGTATMVVSQQKVGVNTNSPRSALDVVGDSLFTGHLLPADNVTYDLGSPTQRWRDLYLSGNSIDISGTILSRIDNAETGVEGDLEVRHVGSNELRSLVVNKVRLRNNDPTVQTEVFLEAGSVEPFKYVIYDRTTEQRTEYVPFSKSSDTGGISIGTPTAQATLHIGSSDPVLASAIFEHSGSASNVLQVKSNDVDRFIVQTSGNVGVGTSFAAFPLHIWGSNGLGDDLVRIHQQGQGNILSLQNSVSGVATVFDGQGWVGIGTTLPLAPLHVVGEQRFDGIARFQQKVFAAQDIEVQGNTITHGDATTDSDLRLKTDLQKIDNALEKVKALTGYTFLKGGNPRRTTGLIAQDVAQVLPEVVYEDQDGGMLSVAYGNMMGLIVEAIKDLSQEIQELKKKL